MKATAAYSLMVLAFWGLGQYLDSSPNDYRDQSYVEICANAGLHYDPGHHACEAYLDIEDEGD